MLKGLNPLLTPDLLYVLRAMGHGDEIAIVDGNFPAESWGPELVRVDGAGAPAVLDAVLSVMSLDPDFEIAAFRPNVPGEDGKDLPIFVEFDKIVKKHEGKKAKLGALERPAFYERSRKAYAIVATSERRFHGNVILRKGVVPPEG